MGTRCSLTTGSFLQSPAPPPTTEVPYVSVRNKHEAPRLVRHVAAANHPQQARWGLSQGWGQLHQWGDTGE